MEKFEISKTIPEIDKNMKVNQVLEITKNELSSLKVKVQNTKSVEKVWTGPKLTKTAWTVRWPSGKETYYNLNMSNVVDSLKRQWIQGEYRVRKDGVKMYGKYVMVAANWYRRGTIIPTSLGAGIVCDRGGMTWKRIDIAVTWGSKPKKKKQ